MQRRYVRIGLITLLLIQVLPGRSYSLQDRKWQRILIETRKPYDGIVRTIEAEGGRVTQTFTYVDGIAADVPEDVVPLISSLPEVQSISKDEPVEKPANVNPIRSHNAGQAQQNRIATDSSSPLSRILPADLQNLANTRPDTYSINNSGTRIERLHASGFTGDGIVVAVIDSGVRAGFKLAQDSFIGGIDFVDDGAPGPAGDSPDGLEKGIERWTRHFCGRLDCRQRIVSRERCHERRAGTIRARDAGRRQIGVDRYGSGCADLCRSCVWQ